MILLSKVIKSPFAITTKEQVKTIEIKPIFQQDFHSDIFPESENESEIEEKIDIESIVAEAKQEAERIVQQALDEAAAIRQEIEQKKTEALDEIVLLKEQAKQEGYEEGFHQGKLEAFAQYESIIDEAQKIVDLSKQDYLNTIEKSEPVIIDLAMAVSKKIIGDTINENADAWNIVLKKVIEEVREHEEVKIYVHPNWYERTLAQKEELQNLLHQSQELYIYPSASQDEHICIVETPLGRLDASIDSQLEEVKIQLHEKLREGME